MGPSARVAKKNIAIAHMYIHRHPGQPLTPLRPA
jgi:hypothetical protein